MTSSYKSAVDVLRKVMDSDVEDEGSEPDDLTSSDEDVAETEDSNENADHDDNDDDVSENGSNSDNSSDDSSTRATNVRTAKWSLSCQLCTSLI